MGKYFLKKRKNLIFFCDDFGVLNDFWVNLAVLRQKKPDSD